MNTNTTPDPRYPSEPKKRENEVDDRGAAKNPNEQMRQRHARWDEQRKKRERRGY